MGAIQTTSSKPGIYQIGASGKNSQKRDTIINSKLSSYGIPGKIISQLIEKLQEQLAYHEQEVKEIKNQIDELNQFSENLINDD